MPKPEECPINENGEPYQDIINFRHKKFRAVFRNGCWTLDKTTEMEENK